MSALYTGLWWAAGLSLIGFAAVTWIVLADEPMRGADDGLAPWSASC